ncbi:hypothetical protein J6497_10385 [Bradyrhizobium sp. CNPSo 4026]|nr:hypothetical protein [Bradyrhizobium cenepequi]
MMKDRLRPPPLGLDAETAALGYPSRALWNSGQGAFGYPQHAPPLAAGNGLK